MRTSPAATTHAVLYDDHAVRDRFGAISHRNDPAGDCDGLGSERGTAAARSKGNERRII